MAEKNLPFSKEQLESIIENHPTRFIFTTRRPFLKMHVISKKHFRGTKVLKNIMQLKLHQIHT